MSQLSQEDAQIIADAIHDLGVFEEFRIDQGYGKRLIDLLRRTGWGYDDRIGHPEYGKVVVLGAEQEGKT